MRDVAVSVKASDDLSSRDMEKLLIECIFWQRRGIAWVLVFKNRLPQPRTLNLKFFENGIRHDDVKRKGLDCVAVAESFERNWGAHKTYLEILRATSDSLGIDTQDAHMALGAAVWAHVSHIDIDTSPLSYVAPVTLLH